VDLGGTALAWFRCDCGHTKAAVEWSSPQGPAGCLGQQRGLDAVQRRTRGCQGEITGSGRSAGSLGEDFHQQGG
jgi:hypothetical protein